ncbi:MAG: hypothetical protein R2716_00290 [Microthrixaceae bacterium]
MEYQRSERRVGSGDPTSDSSTRARQLKSIRGTPHLPPPGAQNQPEPDLFTRLYALAREADRIGGEVQRQVVALLSRALLSEADKAVMRADLEAPSPEPEVRR